MVSGKSHLESIRGSSSVSLWTIVKFEWILASMAFHFPIPCVCSWNFFIFCYSIPAITSGQFDLKQTQRSCFLLCVKPRGCVCVWLLMCVFCRLLFSFGCNSSSFSEVYSKAPSDVKYAPGFVWESTLKFIRHSGHGIVPNWCVLHVWFHMWFCKFALGLCVWDPLTVTKKGVWHPSCEETCCINAISKK